MNVSFVLHFYQPSNQFGEIIKKVATECYIPLIKYIKENKKFHVTINISLSLLEQLERYGFSGIIKDIKYLSEQGRVELLGSGAYHPLLTKIPFSLAEKQITLNEMALGYYFGSKRDFEGEPCLMFKDIKGFFPPEMAVSDSVVSLIESFGYEYILADDYCLPDEVRNLHKGGMCYTVGGGKVKLVVRNRALTNLISFKRDVNVASVVREITMDGSDKVIALDAETFGHHYKEGIYMLDSLARDIISLGVSFSTVTEALQSYHVKNIEHIRESTWSSQDDNAYPLWENSMSDVNTLLWDLFNSIHAIYMESNGSRELLSDDAEAAYIEHPAWLGLDPSLPDALRDELSLDLAMLKLEQSDQFWWSAGVEIMGRKNYSKYMVDSVLDYYESVLSRLPQGLSLGGKISQLKSAIESMH